MANEKILIVENDNIIAMDIETRLIGDGYEVCGIVSDGEQAVEHALRLQPNLILMDIRLEGKIDGIEAARQIRSHCDFPIVYLTAYADDDTLRRAKVNEPFGYLIKPFNGRSLRTAVEIALYKHRMESKLRENERNYRNLFDAVPVGIFRSTPDGRILDANQAMVSMLGYPDKESLLQVNAADLYADKKARSLWRELMEDQGIIRNFEMRLKRSDNSIIWIKESARAKKNPEDVVTHYEGVIEDITEQKFAEIRLLMSEEKFRGLYQEAPVAYFTVSIGQRIVDCNRMAQTLSGYNREELVGMDIMTLFPESSDARKKARHIFSGIPNEESVHRREILMQKKDGGLLWANLMINALVNKNGDIIATRCAISDITEKVNLEKQLQQSMKMEAIGTLAGGIAHDFNNILSIIIGYSELGEMDLPADSKIREFIHQVLKAAYRAKDLVNQILTFSRQTKEELKPFDIRPIVKEALKFLRASLPTTIEIISQIDPNREIISCDPTQIHQVLMNLCTNARHAMQDSGGVLKVSLENVTVASDNELDIPGLSPGTYVQLTVSDTGCGMEPSVMNRIFEPYFTTKSVGEGTGMGLSVVHGIIESHGGKISVSSFPDKGTTFKIFFPLAKRECDLKSTTCEAQPQGVERILFVDDEPQLIDLGKSILERLGYQVSSRVSSLEALELIRSRPEDFDLVITDLTMPHMAGDRLARKLLEINPNLPIILCTGFSDQISAEETKKIGIRSFMTKPLSSHELAIAVRKVLDEDRSRKKSEHKEPKK